MISDNQLPDFLKEIIDNQTENYQKTHTTTIRNKIPETSDIPIEDPVNWIKIPKVICVFADMKNSTSVCKDQTDSNTARAFKYFTETITRLFHDCDASYIDIKGDGAFALYNDFEPHRALASAVTVKTFCIEEFTPKVNKDFSVEVGVHIGIDAASILVRKCGLKRRNGRTDRQNEVWAGKPVNMAAKLASLSENDEIIASERFHVMLTDKKALHTCGCPDGTSVELWTKIDVGDTNINLDFETAYSLGSKWCSTHGKEYCQHLLDIDQS